MEYLDLQTGNMQFYKCAEGFLEAAPQSIFQLAVLMRDEVNLFNLDEDYTMNSNDGDGT